jgi:ubiquinone/menaquinone biosynthesis C-methylase UbiE
MKNVSKQYNNFSAKFSRNHIIPNQKNRDLMFKFVGKSLKGKRVLDVGCGDGFDLEYYAKLGAKGYGIDASSKLLAIATERLPKNDIRLGFAEKLPYRANFFDFVLSKYAIMTSANLNPIFSEMYRVLKPHGILIYLCTHPLRQYIEKKKSNADYFRKEIVTSRILDNTITVKEPSHTFNEYFNLDFFSKFEMLDFVETYDPAAEKIHNATYPGFFIVKARKKSKSKNSEPFRY